MIAAAFFSEPTLTGLATLVTACGGAAFAWRSSRQANTVERKVDETRQLVNGSNDRKEARNRQLVDTLQAHGVLVPPHPVEDAPT